MSRKGLTVLIIVLVLAIVVIPGLLIGIFALADLGSAGPSFGSLGSALGYLEIEGTITDSRQFISELHSMERNPMVKGLLIRVDSPGGAVTPSHEIYSEIKRVRESGKPVVVSMGTLAASGGYYVSCPADVIVANPGTLTGSIGVIMEFPILRRLMDKVGLDVSVVKSAEHKDIGSPFREMTESDRALLQGVVSDVYDQFLTVVSTERRIPVDSLRRIADGRILTGRQAKAYGLVDSLGTFEDAKRIAAKLCGIRGEPRLVKPRPRLRSLLVQLLEGSAENLLGWPRFPRLSYRWP
jgi:protease-4